MTLLCALAVVRVASVDELWFCLWVLAIDQVRRSAMVCNSSFQHVLFSNHKNLRLLKRGFLNQRIAMAKGSQAASDMAIRASEQHVQLLDSPSDGWLWAV